MWLEVVRDTDDGIKRYSGAILCGGGVQNVMVKSLDLILKAIGGIKNGRKGV